jgi:RNA polymerase sigma factor (sigma-70 family)
MDQKQFGIAYENGCKRTLNFLLSRGLSEDQASETAQAAWVRGWERRNQIRDEQKTLTWVNSIALNMYRSNVRRERNKQEFQEMAIPPRVNLAGIDLERMLNRCSNKDRTLLEKRYLEGYDIGDLARENCCTATAIRVRLMRARRNLRQKFAKRPELYRFCGDARVDWNGRSSACSHSV